MLCKWVSVAKIHGRSACVVLPTPSCSVLNKHNRDSVMLCKSSKFVAIASGTDTLHMELPCASTSTKEKWWKKAATEQHTYERKAINPISISRIHKRRTLSISLGHIYTAYIPLRFGVRICFVSHPVYMRAVAIHRNRGARTQRQRVLIHCW